MANSKSETNAQNSEINPLAHPAGARIEKMMEEHERRRSARNKDEPAEGARKEVDMDLERQSGHRKTPEDRTSG